VRCLPSSCLVSPDIPRQLLTWPPIGSVLLLPKPWPWFTTPAAFSGQLAPYRLYYDRAEATPPRWLTNTRIWRQAAAAVRAVPLAARLTMIHRDFHPEYTLWSRCRLTGVVDWTQASWGPPGLDLGHMPWNLVLDGGQPIADRFLACYQAITGTSLDDQPYWDLVSLFDLLLDGDPDHPGDIDADDQRRLTTYAKKVLCVYH
jgi:phosphotransferase family enzyme